MLEQVEYAATATAAAPRRELPSAGPEVDDLTFMSNHQVGAVILREVGDSVVSQNLGAVLSVTGSAFLTLFLPANFRCAFVIPHGVTIPTNASAKANTPPTKKPPKIRTWAALVRSMVIVMEKPPQPVHAPDAPCA